MHRYVVLVSLVTVLGVAPGVTALGQGLVSSPSQTVRGEVLRLDGSYVYLKDSTGKEVKLHMDRNTMMTDGTALQAGDQVTADVTANGHATFIIKQSSPAGNPPGQEPSR